MIQCRNLEFGYDSQKLIQVSHFQVGHSEKIWIQGPSGSGKSTFLSLLAGITSAQKGQITVKDKDLTKLGSDERALFRSENIGYVHQENHFIDHWTVEQNLNLFSAVPLKEIKDSLQLLGLSEKLITKKIAHLSGGERQRMSLVKVLLEKQSVLLLDEPSSHLDDASFEKLKTILTTRLNERTLILVSHDSRFERSGLKKINFKEINQ